MLAAPYRRLTELTGTAGLVPFDDAVEALRVRKDRGRA
jgi:hypothetical protein